MKLSDKQLTHETLDAAVPVPSSHERPQRTAVRSPRARYAESASSCTYFDCILLAYNNCVMCHLSYLVGRRRAFALVSVQPNVAQQQNTDEHGCRVLIAMNLLAVTNVARGIDLSPSAIGGCYVKSLPGELQQAAAITAAELYPPNAPKLSSPLDALLRPLQAAGTRFWGPQPRTLSVRFTEASSPQLEQKIVQYLNAWKCTVSFALVSP